SVKRESGDHELAIADLVANDAANNDAKTKARKSCAGDNAKLGAREPEFASPIVEDTTANRRADTSGENGEKAGPEQAFGVRGDGYVADFRVICGGCHFVWLGFVCGFTT